MAFTWRHVLIEDDKSVGDSGTETIDINIQDPITALLIRFKVKNDSVVAPNAPPESIISKIELVDGGQVYLSMTGQEAVAAACYDGGKWPDTWLDEKAAANQRITIPLFFGRFLGDEVYGFDPTKLLNPQLKVTWSNSTLHATGQNTLGVTAMVMEGAPSPPLALFWKAIENFVVAGSGVKKIALPTDYAFRRMMIRAYYAQTGIYNVFTHFKLDCDVGKLIPFDLDFPEWADVVKTQFGPYFYHKLDFADHGDPRQAWLDGDMYATANAETLEVVMNCYTSGWNYYALRMVTPAGGALNSQKVNVLVTGYWPESCYCYQFGLPDLPETWFASTTFRDIVLSLTQNLNTATGAVLLQQPRALP